MNFHSEEFDRSTTIPTFRSTAVIKYMATRSLCSDLSNNYPAIRRSLDFSLPIGSLVSSPNISRISSSDSIEQDDLTKFTDQFTETTMNCSSLDVHNRVQEMQLEWLDKNADKNASTIEKMFRTEIETGRQRIENTLRYKSDYERQLKEIHQATLASDEHYQQLLARRNEIHRQLFEYQRQLAQNRGESEFLRSRIQMFNDEIEFYRVKNHSLAARKYKLQYDLDEEISARQVLQMECEVLENEKITNEDIHLSSLDDLRNSLDLHRIATRQPASFFREQLNDEVRRMRSEYDGKIRLYREELHRKYELEFRRYKISRQHSTPTVTREHERRLNDYQREKRDIDKQISDIRGNFQALESQIGRLENEIDQTQMITEGILNSRRRLVLLEQIIREKEKQLDTVIDMQGKFQRQLEYYRADLNRHSKSIEQPTRSILRSSRSYESILDQRETSVRSPDFNAERDCEQLNTLFHNSNVDATAVIHILCHRTAAQRLQICDTFQTLFGQNLGDVIESEMSGNSRKFLKTLLLSFIEQDCFEIRRGLLGVTIAENILIEIFLSRSKNHIQEVMNNYVKLFKTTLEEDLNRMRDVPSKQIFLALLQADRPETGEINEEETADDARNLYEKHLTWIQLLCNRSNEQLKQIFDVYQRFSEVDIEDAVMNETDLSGTLTAIVRIIRDRCRFFAYELHKCFLSSTVNEDALNRIIISRSEIDLVQIQLEYEKISRRTLYDQIQMNTHADYQQAILEFLRLHTESTDRDLRSPARRTRTVQWREINNHRFDRNNQAKLTTLSTISSRLPRSQFLERYSHENDDE